MSKIAEQKAFEKYPLPKEETESTSFINQETFNSAKRTGYKVGYDQAIQDFMEWLKDCSTFTYSNGYKRIDDDLYNKLVEDFKNYIQGRNVKIAT